MLLLFYWYILLYLLIGIVYSILMDELILGNTQRRKGPFNLGSYGLLGSIINGFNLIISQLIIPRVHVNYWFHIFPITFLLVSFVVYSLVYPFLLLDLFMSFLLMILLSSLSVIMLFLLSYTGLSKFSMFGCLRLISQFVAYELILTTILVLVFWSYNDLNLASYYTIFLTFNNLHYFIQYCFNPWLSNTLCCLSSLSFNTAALINTTAIGSISSHYQSLHYSIGLVLYWFHCVIRSLLSLFSSIFYYWFNTTFFNYTFFLLILICILAELNRIPFDLPESESELVAGFITEYSSIYFSMVMLTEYANALVMVFFIIILFSLIFSLHLLLLILISLIRSSLNRLKYDELMTTCWTFLLPIAFTFCLMVLFQHIVCYSLSNSISYNSIYGIHRSNHSLIMAVNLGNIIVNFWLSLICLCIQYSFSIPCLLSIVFWLSVFNWLNDLYIESFLFITYREQLSLIYSIKLLIISELMLFLACFCSLCNFRFISPFSIFSSFPLLACYSFSIPFSNLCILLFSSLPLQSAQIFIKIGFLDVTIESIGQSLASGLLSIILQLKEFLYSFFTLSDCLTGSIFYFCTGLHGLHVVIGTFLFFMSLSMASYNPSLYFMEYSFPLFLSSYYWHFVDWIWFCVFLLIIAYWIIALSTHYLS